MAQQLVELYRYVYKVRRHLWSSRETSVPVDDQHKTRAESTVQQDTPAERSRDTSTERPDENFSDDEGLALIFVI